MQNDKKQPTVASPIEPVVSLPLLLVTAIDQLLCEVNASGCGGDGSLANRCMHLSMHINLEKEKAN
jgi:hypothetical protein